MEFKNPMMSFITIMILFIMLYNHLIVGELVADINPLKEPWQEKIAYKGIGKGKFMKGCHSDFSFRHVEDGFFSDEDIDTLLKMVDKAMTVRPKTAGPSIVHFGDGIIRDGNGMASIYEGSNRAEFTAKEFKLYREMFNKIRDRVKEVNGLEELYFTWPTFVARIVGDPEWSPKEIHDEYWHPHVDKENQFHYDYSGLVYMSDYGVDFEGGEFEFLDEKEPKVVHPRKGRLITFASGNENLHKFNMVTKGTRYVFSMWFSCYPGYKYDFLEDEASYPYEVIKNAEKEDL